MKKRTRPLYQYEPLVTPTSWKGDEQQFSIRLTQILDDLYQKVGTLRHSVVTTEDVYPVGSIYIAAKNVDPAALFGGKWERLEDRFLLAAGDTHQIGETGGSEKHTLTLKELPEHGLNYRISTGGGTTEETGPVLHWSEHVNYREINATVGEGEAFDILPPYIAVYVWKRVS